MLCLGFICTLFALHVFKLRYTKYRQLNRHRQIDECYRSLHLCTLVLLPFYTSHHVLKHFAIVHPTPYSLLWILPESKGFNIVLAATMIHPYLAILACTLHINFMQATILFGIIYTKTKLFK